MRLLVVGGAGYVGGIVRSALEAEHQVRYYDLRPVPGAEDRCVVADVNDDEAIARAMAGIEAVLYLAMGTGKDRHDCSVINPAFDVNVRGLYRFLASSLKQGVTRFVYASTLSVYKRLWKKGECILDEGVPSDAWDVYGVSKRLGEMVCQMASQEYPRATICALRLMMPRTTENFADYRFDPKNPKTCNTGLGPHDTERLFLAALACGRPGLHVIQATGDMMGQQFDHSRAKEILGWVPEDC
ncbi:MAG: NAD(P)-dependent oxidoreductase [Phycisphaeraceae bacterium]|nr:NAD(P)-dependent oxidoreductase [Phycisphaeraceae bacterium]